MKGTLSLMLLVGILCMLQAGCADTHNITRSNPAVAAKLTAKDSFYISVSRDVVYGEDKNEGSGLTLSQIIQSSVSKRARRVEVGAGYQPFDEALLFARKNSFKYLIYPTILHWEDHATEWNGVSDKVEVKIEIVDSMNENVIDSAVISGKSGLATIGGDKPQDLLPIPVEEFLAGLF